MEPISEYALRCHRTHIQERLRRDKALLKKDISEKRLDNARKRIECNEELLYDIERSIMANAGLRQNDEALKKLKQQAFDELKKCDDAGADFAHAQCEMRAVYRKLPCNESSVKQDVLGKLDGLAQECCRFWKSKWEREANFCEILDTIDEKLTGS